jgi:hypothetical protein
MREPSKYPLLSETISTLKPRKLDLPVGPQNASHFRLSIRQFPNTLVSSGCDRLGMDHNRSNPEAIGRNRSSQNTELQYHRAYKGEPPMSGC